MQKDRNTKTNLHKEKISVSKQSEHPEAQDTVATAEDKSDKLLALKKSLETCCGLSLSLSPHPPLIENILSYLSYIS